MHGVVHAKADLSAHLLPPVTCMRPSAQLHNHKMYLPWPEGYAHTHGCAAHQGATVLHTLPAEQSDVARGSLLLSSCILSLKQAGTLGTGHILCAASWLHTPPPYCSSSSSYVTMHSVSITPPARSASSLLTASQRPPYCKAFSAAKARTALVAAAELVALPLLAGNAMLLLVSSSSLYVTRHRAPSAACCSSSSSRSSAAKASRAAFDIGVKLLLLDSVYVTGQGLPMSAAAGAALLLPSTRSTADPSSCLSSARWSVCCRCMLDELVERMASCGSRLKLLLEEKGRAVWRVRSAAKQGSRGHLSLGQTIRTITQHGSGSMAMPRSRLH